MKGGQIFFMKQAVLNRNLRKVGVVVASVLIATLLTFPLASRMTHSRDLLFVAAVILVSRYEGGIAGICVALLSVLSLDWFFDRTPQVLDFTIGNGMRIIVFVSVSVAVAVLDHQRRQTLGKLAATNRMLQKALDEIKTLRGILMICSYCKKIETDPQTWVEVESYVRNHSEAEFSHGICPDCLQKLYPQQRVDASADVAG